MIISLMGFMGCGKSSVGRKLSTLLSCSYADLDDIIEKKQGRSIPEIFAKEGEASFRLMELEALGELTSKPNSHMVVSLGGGTIMTPDCAKLIHEKTVCIYLRTSVETLAERLENEVMHRPMLSSAISDKEGIAASEALHERIAELMSTRVDSYIRNANIIIDTDGKSVGQIADEIRFSLL